MKVLSVNYPKSKADDEKLDWLVRSYSKELSQIVLIEMKKNSIKGLDQNLIDRHKANMLIQFRELWLRNVKFINR